MVASRSTIEALISRGAWEDLERLIAADRRVVRRLVSLSYRDDPALREGAARCLGVAARHHPRHVQETVRRLVWAMNDESGTNAVTAPAVILAIAREAPEVLLPVVPDLVRLAGDETLHEGLAAALRTITERCPGEVGRRLGASITSP